MYYKESTREPWSTVQSVMNLNSQSEWEPQASSLKEKVGTPPQNPIMINRKRVFVIGNGESRKKIDLAELNKYGKIYGCNALYRDYTPDALICIDDRMMHQVYWSGYAEKNICYFRDWHKLPAEVYETVVQSHLIYDDHAQSLEGKVYENPRNGRNEFVLHGQNVDRIKDLDNIIRTNPQVVEILREEDYEMLTGAKASGLWISWVAEEDKVTSTDFLPGDTDYGFSAGPLCNVIATWVEKPDEVYLIGMDLYSQTDSVNNMYKDTEGYLKAAGNAIPPDSWIKNHKMIFDKFPEVQYYKANPDPLTEEDPISQEIKEWKDTPNLEYLTYADMFGRLANQGEIT